MYYTTSGSYKKTKMIIDYTNIVLTVAATVIFIIVLFLRSRVPSWNNSQCSYLCKTFY